MFYLANPALCGDEYSVHLAGTVNGLTHYGKEPIMSSRTLLRCLNGIRADRVKTEKRQSFGFEIRWLNI